VPFRKLRPALVFYGIDLIDHCGPIRANLTIGFL